jgi:uncharacterized RDD family membrane protein YckC
MSPFADLSAAPGAHAIDTDTEVETPECVLFRYRMAGPTRRLTAYALDLLVRGGVMLIAVVALRASSLLSERDLEEAASGVMLVILFSLEWGYYVLFETLWDGRTPGKQALGLRVVKEEGHPIRFVDSVLRNLLRAADFLPVAYALGFVVMASDRRFRRLGDRVAATMVVVEERRRVAAPLSMKPPPTADEIESFAQRPRLSAVELEALELFLRRAATLGPSREQELAEMIAPSYAKRLSLQYRDPTRFLALMYRRATEREPSQRRDWGGRMARR